MNGAQRVVVVVPAVLLGKPAVVRVLLLAHAVPCVLQPATARHAAARHSEMLLT